MRYRRKDAAKYLTEEHGIACSMASLAKRAVVGGGPAYRLIGRYPMYDKADLDAWATLQISPLYRSTSEYVGQRQHTNESTSTATRAA